MLTALGVLLLFVAAWGVLKALGSRVTSVDDVERSTGLVVIGTVPRRVLGRSGPATDQRLLSSEADGFQSICRMLKHNGLGTGIRVVTVVPSSPSQSGSNFAAGLAHSLVHAGQDVVLVRANLRQPATEPVLGGSSKGLADLLQDDCSDPVPLLVSVTHHLLVLPAGTPQQDPAVLLSKPKLGEVMEPLRHLGMIMVVDAPPASFAGDVLALAREADATLLVVRAGSRWVEVEQAARTLRYGHAGDPAAVLIGVRRWGTLAVDLPPNPGIDSGTVV